MLLPEERQAITLALKKVLIAEDRPRRLLADVVFGSESDKIPGELGFLATPGQYAEAVLIVCYRYGSAPPLIVTLLDFLIENGAGPLATIRDRVINAPLPIAAADPHHDLWLATVSQPFFDRVALRGPLSTLITGTASPILRVRAPDGTIGRTYTTQLIQHIAKVKGEAVRPLYSLVGPKQGPTHQVTDLASALLEPLEPGPPPERSSSSYAGAISRWILTQLSNRAEAFVMVLDGYGQPQLNPEVVETIDALAGLLTTGEQRSRHRLVLLDYERALTVSAADVLEETLQLPEAVTDAELRATIEAISGARVQGGLEPIPTDGVPLFAATIIASAAAAEAAAASAAAEQAAAEEAAVAEAAARRAGGKARLTALNAGLKGIATFAGPGQ